MIFQNPAAKPAWQISAEIKLAGMESRTTAIRSKADAIHKDELLPLSNRRNDLQRQAEALSKYTRKEHNVETAARLANINSELAAVQAAHADSTRRFAGAQTEATAAIRLLERASRALRECAGGLLSFSQGAFK